MVKGLRRPPDRLGHSSLAPKAAGSVTRCRALCLDLTPDRDISVMFLKGFRKRVCTPVPSATKKT